MQRSHGERERDGYDPNHTHVVFDLDGCGSKCLGRISDYIMEVKEKVPSLDYPAIGSSRSVHEWIHYPAAVAIVSERRDNAINFWDNKHPLANMKVTVHCASSSWKPPCTHINEVSLEDIKKEVKATL